MTTLENIREQRKRAKVSGISLEEIRAIDKMQKLVDEVGKPVISEEEKAAQKKISIIDLMYNKGKKGGDIDKRNE